MDNIDNLIISLEKMIDARQEMNTEEYNCNYKTVMNIREYRYNPAKEEIKKLLDDVIRDTVKKMFKNRSIDRL
jgi:uncharacterized lipoprotein YajG